MKMRIPFHEPFLKLLCFHVRFCMRWLIALANRQTMNKFMSTNVLFARTFTFGEIYLFGEVIQELSIYHA